jgi:hypothetical protein
MNRNDFAWLLDNTENPRRILVTSKISRYIAAICLRGDKFPEKLRDGTRIQANDLVCTVETVTGTRPAGQPQQTARPKAEKKAAGYAKWLELWKAGKLKIREPKPKPTRRRRKTKAA